MEHLLWGLFLFLAVVVSVLAVRIYYRRKYDPIFRQLSELPSDKKEVESDEPPVTPVKEVDETTDNPTNIAMNETVQVDKFMRRNYEIQFKKLVEAILDEQLYTMPKFGRSEMMKRFHMTGKSISTAFSVNGISVPEFIRECRLEHARKLMVERPDMTLVEIATASGFVHASTFTVDFKNKYGVSPTKYREQARSDELRSES